MTDLPTEERDVVSISAETETDNLPWPIYIVPSSMTSKSTGREIFCCWQDVSNKSMEANAEI